MLTLQTACLKAEDLEGVCQITAHLQKRMAGAALARVCCRTCQQAWL